MQVFNRHVSTRSVAVLGCETLLVSGALMLCARLLESADGAPFRLGPVALATGLCVLCLYYNDMYNLTLVSPRGEMVVRALQAIGATAIILAIGVLVVPSMLLGRSALVTALLVLVLAVPTWRLAFDGLTRDSHLEERILIVGTGPTAHTLAQLLGTQRNFAYRLVGFVADDTAVPVVRRHDVLGRADDIDRLVAERRINRIVVGMTDRRGQLPVAQLLRAKFAGVRVEDATTTYERLTGKILIDDLKPSWLIFSDGFRASRTSRAAKRLFDIAVSSLGFLLAAPLMALTALAVSLDSVGPVLYRQERVGERGGVFTLYKFRSMRADAEQGTPVWARQNDDRVTRIGRFIRLTRLDELPQLWNVLRGDMSFVGPRPERPFFVQHLTQVIPFYGERHTVKPGITGWAQVEYQYGASIEDAMEKLRYDLYYIKYQSVVFDVTIMLDTFKVILSRKGAQ